MQMSEKAETARHNCYFIFIMYSSCSLSILDLCLVSVITLTDSKPVFPKYFLRQKRVALYCFLHPKQNAKVDVLMHFINLIH